MTQGATFAEGVLKEQLRQRGWREAELSRRRKGDPEKVEVAWQLRAQTTMTLKWIAERLKNGGVDPLIQLPGSETQRR